MNKKLILSFILFPILVAAQEAFKRHTLKGAPDFYSCTNSKRDGSLNVVIETASIALHGYILYKNGVPYEISGYFFDKNQTEEANIKRILSAYSSVYSSTYEAPTEKLNSIPTVGISAYPMPLPSPSPSTPSPPQREKTLGDKISEQKTPGAIASEKKRLGDIVAQEKRPGDIIAEESEKKRQLNESSWFQAQQEQFLQNFQRYFPGFRLGELVGHAGITIYSAKLNERGEPIEIQFREGNKPSVLLKSHEITNQKNDLLKTLFYNANKFVNYSSCCLDDSKKACDLKYRPDLEPTSRATPSPYPAPNPTTPSAVDDGAAGANPFGSLGVIRAKPQK